MKYDVAIVGAGPSGAWTATRLARAGARVVLLDPSHPREKPCGGGITQRALEIVGDPVLTLTSVSTPIGDGFLAQVVQPPTALLSVLGLSVMALGSVLRRRRMR